MIEFLFWVVWIINIIMVLKKKNNKVVVVITLAISIAIYFLHSDSGDYETYYYSYNDYLYTGFEIGFVWLMKIAKSMSLSYVMFRGIICCASLFIILYVFGKFSRNYPLFFSLYYIYQFFYDVDTLRNFLARAIIFLAFYYLIRSNKTKYLIMIVVAALIHRASIVYIPLMFIDPKKGINRKLLKYGTVIVIVLCVVAFASGYRFSFISSVGMRLFAGSSYASKISALLSRTTRFGFAIYFVMHLGSVFLVYYGRKYETENESNITSLLCKYCRMANVYAIIFFPLIMINVVSFRFFNNIILLNFTMYACCLDLCKSTTTRYYKYLMMIFIVTLLYKLPFVHSSSEMERILESIRL